LLKIRPDVHQNLIKILFPGKASILLFITFLFDSSIITEFFLHISIIYFKEEKNGRKKSQR